VRDVDALMLSHSTAPENARAIMRDGFLESEITLYPGGVVRRGQFVRPTCNTRVRPPYANDYRE